MPIELWLSAQREVDALINLLASEPQYSVVEMTTEYDELVERTPEKEPDNIVRIRGSIISFIDRLDDEFTKSLQNIDPHGTEYLERLRDEKGLYQTICLSQGFYEKTKQDDPLSRVILRRLDHIYSKVHSLLFCCLISLPILTNALARCRRSSPRVVSHFFSLPAFCNLIDLRFE